MSATIGPFAGRPPPAAAYFFSPDRAGEHPARHLADFNGFLQADGYAGFEALYDPAADPARPTNTGIIEVACWAHCRRKFYEVWDSKKSPVAKEAIDRIATFYAIEAKARFAPPAERLTHRAETASLLASFFDWATEVVTRLSAKSELAAAFRYTLKRQTALSRFLADARLEIDNNIAENAIRGVALGRKNYLFAGSDAGGERAASIYTIMQTAKLNSANPEAYLRNTITSIAEGHPMTRIGELMPWSPSSSP